MTGNAFIRKVKALGKQRGDRDAGCIARQGQSQTLYYGSAFTIVRNPKDELKTGEVRYGTL